MQKHFLHIAALFSSLALVAAFFLTHVPAARAAATAHFSTEQSDIQQGDQIGVALSASVDQPVNAVQATLHFDPARVKLESVQTANSVVPLWLDFPSAAALAEANQTGSVTFSGVMPGGISTLRNDQVLFFIFRAKQQGGTTISLGDDSLLYLNDGTGASIAFNTSPFALDIMASSRPAQTIQGPDHTPPVPFDVVRARSNAIFNGEWFISFTTRDAETAVDHYEVAECRTCSLENPATLKWRTASSPYLLRDQSLHSTVFVKAVDQAGNTQITTLPALPGLDTKGRLVFLIFLVLGLLATAFIWAYDARHLRRK